MSRTARELVFLKRLLVVLAVAMLAVAAIRSLRPSRLGDAHVTGGSMANSFWGPSFRVTCGDCRFSFRCDAASDQFIPRDRKAVCPNCAFEDNPLESSNIDSIGQRVKLAPTGSSPPAIDRWATIAFRSPDDAQTVNIKRIVGLPNERIEIRHGDIYADGHLVRKSLAAQRKQCVLVHDATFRARRPSQSARWIPRSAVGEWKQTETGFVFHPAGERPSDTAEWLEYQNVPTEPLAVGIPRPREAPINDNSAYNQGIARDLNDVHDIMLSCWVRLAGAGELTLSADHGGRPIEISISAEGRLSLCIGDQLVKRARIPSMVGQPRKIEFSLFDRQCLFAVNGRTQVLLPLPAQSQRSPNSKPFRIGAKNLHVFLCHLKIHRDTFYLNDRGLALPYRAERRLAADEYFVLGDNPPISRDSRHWPQPGVTRKSLIGRVAPAGRVK